MVDKNYIIPWFIPAWAERELLLFSKPKVGLKGDDVKKTQEWLSLHGIGVQIDGIFGPATERAVKEFQEKNNLETTGIVDAETFELLINPMKTALEIFPSGIPMVFRGAITRYARQHLVQHPREVGGQNKGPWVRLYMKGNDGEDWAWCAGFISFIIRQAARTHAYRNGMPYFYSVDLLVKWAKQNDRFHSGKDVKNKKYVISSGDLFIIRHKRRKNDWIHTGIVLHAEKDYFETAEGNTNDDGSREGYEAVRRIRGYERKDFINMEL